MKYKGGVRMKYNGLPCICKWAAIKCLKVGYHLGLAVSVSVGYHLGLAVSVSVLLVGSEQQYSRLTVNRFVVAVISFCLVRSHPILNI